MWKKLTTRPALGYVLQLWSSRHPRGFEYRQYGESKRMLRDFEGLALVSIRSANKKNRVAKHRLQVKGGPPAKEEPPKNQP